MNLIYCKYYRKKDHYHVTNKKKFLLNSNQSWSLNKGEKDLNTIAAEKSIQPNLFRNWKKEFLDKASVVFDDTL